MTAIDPHHPEIMKIVIFNFYASYFREGVKKKPAA